MFKNFFILSLLLVLTNCGPVSTAFLGPAFTGVTTGSPVRVGMSYGTNHLVKTTRVALQKVEEAKTITFQKVNQLNKKIQIDKLNKVVLRDQADLFFKAVKNNLKNYN